MRAAEVMCQVLKNRIGGGQPILWVNVKELWSGPEDVLWIGRNHQPGHKKQVLATDLNTRCKTTLEIMFKDMKD